VVATLARTHLQRRASLAGERGRNTHDTLDSRSLYRVEAVNVVVVVQTAERGSVESETDEIVGWVDTTLGAECLSHFKDELCGNADHVVEQFMWAKCLDQDHNVSRRLVCRERK
jgi:hypothetical protein